MKIYPQIGKDKCWTVHSLLIGSSYMLIIYINLKKSQEWFMILSTIHEFCQNFWSVWAQTLLLLTYMPGFAKIRVHNMLLQLC